MIEEQRTDKVFNTFIVKKILSKYARIYNKQNIVLN